MGSFGILWDFFPKKCTGFFFQSYLPLAFIGVVAKCSTSIALHTYYVWTMELYDTELRASSLGLANIACRIGGASAPWIAKGNYSDVFI